jgi:hypothetical protein
MPNARKSAHMALAVYISEQSTASGRDSGTKEDQLELSKPSFEASLPQFIPLHIFGQLSASEFLVSCNRSRGLSILALFEPP